MWMHTNCTYSTKNVLIYTRHTTYHAIHLPRLYCNTIDAFVEYLGRENGEATRSTYPADTSIVDPHSTEFVSKFS